MKQTQYTIIQNELISKEKWKSDKDVSKCERCDKPFNVLIRRKHHCRRCGYIYCQDCSSHFLDAHPTSTEKKIRLCRKCYDYVTQLISAKGFILGIEDQVQSKIETSGHSRNPSRHQETQNTFISSKSTIVKGHEISFQYEDEDTQELDQELNQQDITEFFDQEESIKQPDTDVAKCQQLQLKEKASSQLDKICEYLLQNVLQQPAKVIEQWKFLMKHFILQCVEDLQFVSLNQDPMDINYFVKTKIINYHDNTLTGYFKGVIFRKNVALKQMQCEIQNPTILIIIGEFDMASSQNQLEEYINNEEKTVIEYVNKISKHLNPNLILVEKGANKIALDICLKKRITVLTNVKLQVLKRIRLCTGAKFIKLQRLDQYIEKKDKIMGRCLKVSFKNFPKGTQDKGIQKDSTLCFLETADAKKFATILISGPQEDLLSKLKQCFVGCVRLGKHQDLETNFIETETKMIQSKYMQGKPILSCGNFTTYLFEKVSIKELFSSELQYQKVNYVLADIHNFNDIKDFSSLEEYKKKHPTQNARIEEFSIAKMCHMPQELKMQYQSGRDICLGHFIILKVSNKDKKCDQCKLPKNSHITFYYCGSKYVKISVDQELRGERIISTNEVPVLMGQISQSSQFSQLSNEDENNFNAYTAKDVQKLVQQTHSNQKGEKKKIPIQTYIECSKCLEVLSNKVKLTPSNLEFSFLRFIQTLFLAPVQSEKGNSDKQKDNTCIHQPQRIFSYDESIVKVTAGDVDIYSIQFLRLWDDQNCQKFNAWEKQYVLDKLRELQLKFVTSVTHFSNQIKKHLLRNIPIEEIEQLQDESKWQEVQQKITFIHQLQQLTQELGIKLLNVSDYIKSEIKKTKYTSAQKLWDNTKESIIKSTRELDTPHNPSIKSDAKLNYSGKDEDLGNSNSDYMPDNDVDSVIETLGDLKSPKNRTRTPTVKTNATQHFSVKELDSQIHSFSVQGEKLLEFNLHKEWQFSGFHKEQERIRTSQKIIQFVPIFENHSISYLAFALNHPQYLQKIGYFENFTFTDDVQKKNIMKKFLVQKSEVQSWKIESQDDSLREQANDQGAQIGKKEKNYITISIQYDNEKGLRPSQSKDQLLDDEMQSLPSQSQILNPQQLQVQVQKQQKKSKYLEVLIYFPHQFEALRTYCGINLALFIKSLNTIHNWNVSGGKSTSKFYKSHNELFVVKKFDDEKEFKMFEQFAGDYFDFMNRHFLKDKASLLCKILGMYEIRDKGASEFYLVMENLYYGMGDPKDLRVYDLKGSETNRWEKKLNKVLLDTNFIVDRNAEPIPIVNHDYGYLDRAIQNDSKFLVNLQIIDYSLLLIIDEKQKKLRLGIIDYLRFYTWDKETEHYLKYILKGRKVPTIVNPSDYKDRFVNAARKYFIRL